MRRIGAARAVSAAGMLPEVVGPRGCALLTPNFLVRTSYSGASGRDGGTGSSHDSSHGVGRGSGRGRGAVVLEEFEKREQGPADELGAQRIAQWGDGVQTQGRGVGVGAVPPRAGAVPPRAGRGRGDVFQPSEGAVEGQESKGFGMLDLFGRGRGASPPTHIAGLGRGSLSSPFPIRAPSEESRFANADGSEQGVRNDDTVGPSPLSSERSQTAVEKLLAKISTSNSPKASNFVNAAGSGQGVTNEVAASADDNSRQKFELGELKNGNDDNLGSTPFRSERAQSAVEKLLAKLTTPVLPKASIPVCADGSGQGVGNGVNSSANENSRQKSELSELGIGKGDNVSPSLPVKSDGNRSAVEELLAKLTKSEPVGSSESQSQAPPKKSSAPFRMPFALPKPVLEEPVQDNQQQLQPQQEMSTPKPIFQAQVPLPLGSLGRGRGKTIDAEKPAIGSDLEASRAFDSSWDRQEQESSPPRRFDRSTARNSQGPPRPPSPPRMQLSVEEARTRAISILEKGIEKNVAAEGERRRIAGMDKFADASEFFSDRFRRVPGGVPSSQTPGPRAKIQRSVARSDRPRRQRPDEAAVVVSSPEQVQLTKEQEEQILRTQQEDTFKERLHNLFLVQFEPEYAMEEFGRNPDIDESPVVSLEDYLQNLKPMFLAENAELSEEQKWEDAVKSSLANAPNLEKLVEAYAGPGRITARQQIEKLETISQKLPASVPPQVAAFTQRALNTLQNNPGLNMRQKERLMTNIVSGFSSM